MKTDVRHHHPEPFTAQVRRLRTKHGLPEERAALVAELLYGGRP